MKMPRWPFDKFVDADRLLGTQMKATGEVMSIDKSIEGALMKAARSLEQGLTSLSLKSLKNDNIKVLKERIKKATDERFFAVAEALRRKVSIDEIHNLSKIDKFFLEKIQNIIHMEERLKRLAYNRTSKSSQSMQFPDKTIADLTGKKKRK